MVAYVSNSFLPGAIFHANINENVCGMLASFFCRLCHVLLVRVHIIVTLIAQCTYIRHYTTLLL